MNHKQHPERVNIRRIEAQPIGYAFDVAEKTTREAARWVIAENRKARHDYHVIETFESGVALLGTEVKAIREGLVNLRDSYARVEGGQVWMLNVHISPYSHRGYAQHAEMRQRKLLLHRHEIRKLVGQTAEKGLTLVPLEHVLQERACESAAGGGQGQTAARQTGDHPAARGRPGNPRGGQGATAMTG